MPRKLKVHLHRSQRSTWCGKEIEANTGDPRNREEAAVSFQPSPLPKREGWYWAKWHTASPGTDHCRNCGHRHSEWTEPHGLDLENWAVVEVVENCLDTSSPEYLMVQVPGVSKWQPIEGFTWGPQIEEFNPCPEQQQKQKQDLSQLRRLLQKL
jgi:hypothetical protein